MKKRLGKILLWLLVPAVIIGAVYLALDIFHLGGIDAPEMHVFKAEEVQHVDQNWKNDWSLTGTKWFHHANQGTKILPYAWFMALEQPDLSPFHSHGKFVDGDYLTRFGFLPSEKDSQQNPDGLPVGFTKQENFVDPNDPKKQEVRVVGLTCAACHTGEIQYTGSDKTLKAVRIEGGPAMINLSLFQSAVSLALFYTNFFDARYNRFADEVLGDQKNNDNARKALRTELKAVIDKGLSAQAYAQKKGLYELNLGFSRTDALGLIGNRVFGPLGNENLTVANAPVNFPHLWDTAWFDWVQYNASIRMPLVRNIGEALGVGALVKIDNIKPGDRFPSSVNVENLHRIESMLGGDKPYAGLRSPKWEDTDLPRIDPSKQKRGEGLYKKYCQGCHLPPPAELEAMVYQDTKDERGREIWYNEGPKGSTIRVLSMRVVDLQVVGTDANEALNFYRRLADLGYGGNTTSAAKGLYNVTGFIRNQFFASKDFLNIPDGPDQAKQIAAKKLEYDRHRPFDDALLDQGNFDLSDDCVISSVIVAQLGYKARPLNGIWATAPFLHNGAVPSLYQILVPVKDRDRTFYLGTKMFDPIQVGFVTDAFPGGFKLETSESGNTNVGHEYRNLTIAEMELAAMNLVRPDTDLTPVDDRWANVFGMTTQEWKTSTDEQRASKISGMSWDLIKKRAAVTIPKGVIGPELSETERWDLVEFLKSI